MMFDQPNAVAAMNQAVAAVSEAGDCAEVIGKPLDEPLEKTLPAYDKKLSLNLDPSGTDKRLEISELRWGRIEKDAARLNGLAAAIDDISAVVKSGKDRLAHDWKGEAFDAFRAAVEKIEKTLDDYSTAVRTTADGLATAMNNIRTLYSSYRDTSAEILSFRGLLQPDQFKKVEQADLDYLADVCYDLYHGDFDPSGCQKDNDDQATYIVGELIYDRDFERMKSWACQGSASTAIEQYKSVVSWGKEHRSNISRKINEWYRATDELTASVASSYDEALNNLRILAESKVFSALSVPGAPAAGGDPGQGGGGDYSGGAPGGGTAAMPPPMPAPEPAPVEPAATQSVEPAAVEPQPAEPAAEPPAGAGDSVTIKDADRTIAVTSPDGEGHVKVTIEGEDGQAKSYDLDFDAASGMARPDAQHSGDPRTEYVPATTNGQCVIKDGPVTITAERPLFEPGAIKLEVDDGVNEPTTYTLDFEDVAGADQPAADAGPTGEPEPAPDTNAKAEPAAERAQRPAEPAENTPQETPGEPEPEPVAAESGEKEQLTTPQAVLTDEPGSLSGLLVPDQSTGEAELASAGEGEPAGAAGGAASGAMPLMAGAGAAEAARAGTGWSVHGDLFDNHDPVYSMHGVLGEDDLEGR